MKPQEELENYADRFSALKVFIPNIGHMGAKTGAFELPESLEIIEKSLNISDKKYKSLILFFLTKKQNYDIICPTNEGDYNE